MKKWKQRAAPLVTTGLFVLGGCQDKRADTVVYGDHLPALDRAGNPFVNPIAAREDANDAVNLALVKPVAGIQNPKGSATWGLASFGKYVFWGNYDTENRGIFQDIEDQRIGVFDSEKHQACQLDLDPSGTPNAGVQWLAVANPRARQTRLFFEGIAFPRTGGTTPYGFGYVTLDLDNPNPCDPVTGWARRGFTGTQMNAARAAGVAEPCPGGACLFDGMALLSHDEATQTDTLVLGNWGAQRVVIARVNGAGQLSVPAVHVLAPWKPPGETVCRSMRPVGAPAVDWTRPSGDRRFLWAFDSDCGTEVDPPGCAPWPRRCPRGTAANGQCNAYCSSPHPFGGAYIAPPSGTGTCGEDDEGNPIPESCGNVNFFGNCLNLGTATTEQLPVHPNAVCSPAEGGASISCRCELPARGSPFLEMSFDGTAVTEKSPRFQVEAGKSSLVINGNTFGGGYHSSGDLFVASFDFPSSAQTKVHRYARTGAEHAYTTTADVVVPPTQTFDIETANPFSVPSSGVELGNGFYHLTQGSIQREHFGFGLWAKDTSYKVSLPTTSLPHESYYCDAVPGVSCAPSSTCAGGTPCPANGQCPAIPVRPCKEGDACAGGGTCPLHRCVGFNVEPRPCSTSADCPSGGTCGTGEGSCFGNNTSLALGGSPASFWASPMAGCPKTQRVNINAWLLRVPVVVRIPGQSTTTAAPGAAWSQSTTGECANEKCDRLWLFAAPGGTQSWKTRDQGLWESNFRALPSNVAVTGVRAAFTGQLELFARGSSDNRLYTSRLTSALSCAPSSCTFSNWQLVPGAPTTNVEPGVVAGLAPDNTVTLYVAVKDTAGTLRWTKRPSGGVFTAFQAVPGLVSDAAPAVVFKTDDRETWLFAREQGTGELEYTTIDGSTSEPWLAVGTGGLAPWGTGPAAAYTGIVRAFAAKGGVTYQTTYANGAWDAWSKIVSSGGSTSTPAPAVVFNHDGTRGDLNLVTTFVGEMYEQLVQ